MITLKLEYTAQTTEDLICELEDLIIQIHDEPESKSQIFTKPNIRGVHRVEIDRVKNN